MIIMIGRRRSQLTINGTGDERTDGHRKIEMRTFS